MNGSPLRCGLVLAALAAGGCSQLSRVASPWRTAGDTTTQQLAMARLIEQQGDPAQAEKIYHKILEREPRNVDARHRLAVMAARSGRLTEAHAQFQDVIAMAPKNADLWNDHGYALYLDNRLKEAEYAFQRALDSDPQHASAANNLGMVLGAQGRSDESLDMFLRVVPPAEAQANLAFVLSQYGQTQAAQDFYNRALSRDNELRPAAEGLLQLAQYHRQVEMMAAKRPVPHQPPAVTPLPLVQAPTIAPLPLEETAQPPRGSMAQAAMTQGPGVGPPNKTINTHVTSAWPQAARTRPQFDEKVVSATQQVPRPTLPKMMAAAETAVPHMPTPATKVVSPRPTVAPVVPAVPSVAAATWPPLRKRELPTRRLASVAYREVRPVVPAVTGEARKSLPMATPTSYASATEKPPVASVPTSASVRPAVLDTKIAGPERSSQAKYRSSQSWPTGWAPGVGAADASNPLADNRKSKTNPLTAAANLSKSTRVESTPSKSGAAPRGQLPTMDSRRVANTVSSNKLPPDEQTRQIARLFGSRDRISKRPTKPQRRAAPQARSSIEPKSTGSPDRSTQQRLSRRIAGQPSGRAFSKSPAAWRQGPLSPETSRGSSPRPVTTPLAKPVSAAVALGRRQPSITGRVSTFGTFGINMSRPNSSQASAVSSPRAAATTAPAGTASPSTEAPPDAHTRVSPWPSGFSPSGWLPSANASGAKKGAVAPPRRLTGEETRLESPTTRSAGRLQSLVQRFRRPSGNAVADDSGWIMSSDEAAAP